MKALIITALAAVISLTSFAQGPGHQRTHIANHPRVNQVNRRIDNQERRINMDRRDGQISRGQAMRDRRDLSRVNQEKRDMRYTDRGHLTRRDGRALNQQLNRNSRRIYRQS